MRPNYINMVLWYYILYVPFSIFAIFYYLFNTKTFIESMDSTYEWYDKIGERLINWEVKK